MRIEICGGIASGKTTLCEAIGTIGLECAFESFQDNPFWHSYAKGDRSYNFETEVTFLMQHCGSVKAARLKSPSVVCDFSFILDRAYADISMDDQSNIVFGSIVDHVTTMLGGTSLMILLQCDPAIEMERIAQRGRPEEAFFTIDFLKILENKVNDLVTKLETSSNILRLDSGRVDFTIPGAERLHVLN